MNAKRSRHALRSERVLVCTYESAGGFTASTTAKKLATELIKPSKLQPDLFLTANEDGLFPGFSQTWQAGG